MSTNEFRPNWSEQAPPKNTFRSIFKWGDPDVYKHPNDRLYALMRDKFKMTDADFIHKQKEGLEEVSGNFPIALTDEQIAKFEEIVGKENVLKDTYSRLAVAYGKTMLDIMRLREGIIENIPDLAINPRNEDDIIEIVKYCNEEKIAIYVYGGGSSVTRGMEAMKTGICLDMRPHMNRLLKINEINQSVTVQPGMSGPDLENHLNNAPELYGTKRRYTAGHFPQSFEYSSVGGWTVTRGAGQNSTYYGNAKDIVLSQKYITPVGEIVTSEHPASATGPDIDQIMMGSEGTFGVLVSATLKLRRYKPENTERFAYIFKSWKDGMTACREIMQSEFGYPSVFRLSDAEETDLGMKLYGIEGTPLEKMMEVRGFKRGKKCLFLGTSDGHKSFTKNMKKQVDKVCRSYGAMNITSYPVKSWEKGRFLDPYMREDLGDYGLMIDTLECGVTWEDMPRVHSMVRKVCHARPDTICTTHLSHAYPQGANLYFIFITKMNEIDDYVAYHRSILDAIQKNGATMSHHHGIGKQTAPWLEAQLGKNQLDIFRALKKHFDPNGIMNPGGTLGLDLEEDKKRDFINK